MVEKAFKKGELIFQEGSKGDKMYFISAGKVRVYMTVNAEEIDLCELSQNTFFGEMALLLGGTRTASVEAVEDTTALEYSQQSLLTKIKQDPQFALRMITTMARRLKGSHDVITNLESAKKSLEVMYGITMH